MINSKLNINNQNLFNIDWDKIRAGLSAANTPYTNSMQEDNKTDFYHTDNYNQTLSAKPVAPKIFSAESQPTNYSTESYESVPNYSTESYVIPEDELENPNIETPYFKSPILPSLPLTPRNNILYKDGIRTPTAVKSTENQFKGSSNFPIKNSNSNSNKFYVVQPSKNAAIVGKYASKFDKKYYDLERDAFSSMIKKGYSEKDALEYINWARRNLHGAVENYRPTYYADIISGDANAAREKTRDKFRVNSQWASDWEKNTYYKMLYNKGSFAANNWLANSRSAYKNIYNSTSNSSKLSPKQGTQSNTARNFNRGLGSFRDTQY